MEQSILQATPDKIITLEDIPGETYVFGDIHGCFDTFMAFYKSLNIQAEDRIIFDGDLVDRGPKIREILDFALTRPNTEIVFGNHDWALCDYFTPGGVDRNMHMVVYNGLNATFDQLGDDSFSYASRLWDKAVFQINYKDYVICHADYNWKEQERSFDVNTHLWNRIDGRSHKKYNGPVIVHGHTPCKLKDVYEYTPGDKRLYGINLDGGCFMGRSLPWLSLRALRLSDGKIFEQPQVEEPLVA